MTYFIYCMTYFSWHLRDIFRSFCTSGSGIWSLAGLSRPYSHSVPSDRAPLKKKIIIISWASTCTTQRWRFLFQTYMQYSTHCIWKFSKICYFSLVYEWPIFLWIRSAWHERKPREKNGRANSWGLKAPERRIAWPAQSVGGYSRGYYCSGAVTTNRNFSFMSQGNSNRFSGAEDAPVGGALESTPNTMWRLRSIVTTEDCFMYFALCANLVFFIAPQTSQDSQGVCNI